MQRELLNGGVKILEFYLSHAAFELDDELWRKVKAGERRRLSIGGSAPRQSTTS